MSDLRTPTPVSSFTLPSALLRNALAADAVLSGLSALVLTFGAPLLAGPLGLPVGLLRGAGIILIPFAGFVAWLRMQERVQRPIVFAVVGCNLLWVLDSALLLFTGWVEATIPGEVLVIGQALMVAILAKLELVGLQRSTLVEAHARR